MGVEEFLIITVPAWSDPLKTGDTLVACGSRCVVLREATAEEWYAGAIDAGAEPHAQRRVLEAKVECKFYEVSAELRLL